MRWSRLNLCDRIFVGLAAKPASPTFLMIDANHLEAHRIAASLLKKSAERVMAHDLRSRLGGKRRVYPSLSAAR